ncbi:MAG: DUF58 domain-containing protein [Verrucomicrobiia bacterium]
MEKVIPPEILKKIRRIELRTNRLVTETLSGQYHSVFKGQGMNFDEVREYQPGDDVRLIDWNVTARMNHPFIKKFVEERELTVILIVDLSASGVFGSTAQSKRDIAGEVASVLAFSAIRNNDKVGLILFTGDVEKYIAPRKGKRHVLRVIRDILFYEPQRKETNLNAALEFLLRIMRRRAIVVVVSDFLFNLDQTLLRQVNRKHDLVAIQIVDPRELELPDIGRVALEDAETGEIMEINTGSIHIRGAFARRREFWLDELNKTFRSLRIDLIRIMTDKPYAAELERFFKQREKRRLRG